MRLDIVILPPKKNSREIGEVVINLSKQIGLGLAVDNKKLFPHISLFHLRSSKKKLRGLIEAVDKIVGQRRQQNIIFSKPAHGRLYFAVKNKKTTALASLHKDIVAGASKFRTGRENLPPKGRTALQRTYIKKYGAGNILKYFRPHVTLGHAKIPQDMKKILQFIRRARFKNFKATRLAITQVNRHHQVFKIIKEFELT